MDVRVGVKKAECRRIDAFELWCWRRLESPLDCKEIQPVHPKGNQSWIFIGRTDLEAEAPIIWPPDAKSWLIGKDPDAGKDWGQEERGTTEDEMVGWHHWLNGHGFGWTPGAGDGQGGLVLWGSWGHKESDMTDWLNWTELIVGHFTKGRVYDSIVSQPFLPDFFFFSFAWYEGVAKLVFRFFLEDMFPYIAESRFRISFITRLNQKPGGFYFWRLSKAWVHYWNIETGAGLY